MGWPVLVVMWVGDQRQSRALVSLAGCTEWPQPYRAGTKKPAFRWLFHLYQWFMCYNSCEALFV